MALANLLADLPFDITAWDFPYYLSFIRTIFLVNKNKAIYYIIQIYFVFFLVFLRLLFIFAMYNYTVTMIAFYNTPC